MIMIGFNQYKLSWRYFEQLHADKKTVFENLCRSLFKRELCYPETILHSDNNHPGVEVAPVIAKDGHTKISFQAKHFDNRIGYAQIEKSTDEVVKHFAGKLDIIYLYCNKDITETSESYKKIKKKLADVGISIKLITGQTILDQAMNYPSILSCYFGLDSLDDKWFKRNVDISLDNLGKRYNSLFNVETEAQRNLSLFLRETIGIDEVNSKKNNLIRDLKNLRWRGNGIYKDEIESFFKWANSLEPVNLKTFIKALEWKQKFENDCNESLAKLRKKQQSIQEELKKHSYEDSEYNKLRNEEFEVGSILSVGANLEFSRIERTMINCRIVIITGEMGTGKTQLIATAAKRIAESGRPVLLFLGQTFISDESIENQIMQNLEGLSTGQNFESLIAVMDEKAEVIGEEAIIFIDAINESKNREIWKNGINRIITTLEQYRHVKLVISLRTGYEKLTLSESVLDKKDAGDIAMIRHIGFADESPNKIYEFLSNCGIPFSPEYYLHSEMTNPLFLTWFCDTYSGEEQGLLTIIDHVLKQADKEGSKSAGMSEMVGILQPLIYEMLDDSETGIFTKQRILSSSAWNTYGIVNKIEYLNAIERAGIITSFVQRQEEKYYIGYNLLEDYLKATKIIDKEKSKERIIEYCERILLDIDDEGNINKYGNESVFTMVASLYAIKYGEELVEVIDKVKNECDKNYLIDNYCTSFIWRSSYITYDYFFEFINKYPVDPRKVWEVFIENSVKEKCELNALGLTKLLNRYTLNRRDFLWTMIINDFDENDRAINFAYYVEAGNTLEGLSDNKAYLLLITYTWLLSSSNRKLRDRVSMAMIEILKEHFALCKHILELFKEVNDPYIIQRLYGIVFGAVMKRKSENKSIYKELAQWVYTEVFDKEMVYPDILLRDYARLIIERFVTEYPNDTENIILEKIKPPYKSEPIPIVEQVDYGADKYLDIGLWQLLSSMKFDMKVKGMGMYGDFGRYVFQSALECFIDLDKANIYYYAIQYILDTLGYNPEYFAEYDNHRNGYDRHNVKKIERIGKKYQWITMYNILARVSDTYSIKSWDWNNKISVAYEGPWEPYVRDFDPTLNVKIHTKGGIPQIKVPIYGEEGFCDIYASEIDINKWIIEDDKMFKDFPDRLSHRDELGKEWVSLYLYQENKFCPEEEPYILRFPKGEQHIWTVAAMYILPETKSKCKVKDLIDSEFIRHSSAGMRDEYSLFSREYGWSPGYNSKCKEYAYENDESDIKAFPATINFLWEKEYDASQEETTSFAIPAGEIIQEMKLYEKETNGIYFYNDEIVAFDLKILGHEHTELVMRKDVLNDYIRKTGVQVFWTVEGEKQYFQGNLNQKWQRREGYFIYENQEINGNISIVNNN